MNRSAPMTAAHRRSFRYVAFGLLASVACVCGGASSAWAQQVATPAQQGGADTTPAIGEIVVTATKRSTRLDETPMSITAITGAQLAKTGISDVQSALQGVPGVAFATAGPGKTVFNIRGLSSSGGAAATVGFYIDDVPILSPAHSTNGKTAIDPSLYDLAQVEVLRGPQGTLYGASAMGGTIKLETNRPIADKFEASAHIGASNPATGGLGYAADAMVNIPIVNDKVALRVVASQKYDNGYVDRIVNRNFPPAGGPSRGDVTSGPTTLASTKGGDNNNFSIRAALLIKPVEGLEITGSVLRQRQHQNDQGLVDFPTGGMAHYQPADVAEPSHDKVTIYSLVGKLDLGGAQLQSSGQTNLALISTMRPAESAFNSMILNDKANPLWPSKWA